MRLRLQLLARAAEPCLPLAHSSVGPLMKMKRQKRTNQLAGQVVHSTPGSAKSAAVQQPRAAGPRHLQERQRRHRHQRAETPLARSTLRAHACCEGSRPGASGAWASSQVWSAPRPPPVLARPDPTSQPGQHRSHLCQNSIWGFCMVDWSCLVMKFKKASPCRRLPCFAVA